MALTRRIAVIGAGPGGYVAALRAAQLGAQVSLIEEQEVGGTCLNVGCIPSKALIVSAERLDLIRQAGHFGLQLEGEPAYDMERLLDRKRRIVRTQVRGIQALLKSWGISLVKGHGRIEGPRSIEVSDSSGKTRRIETDQMILATGSKPIKPSIFPFDGERIITSEEALEPRSIPKSLLIVGAGIEGCEFAFLYQSLGAVVTMVELKGRVLPTEDEEVAFVIHREMKKRKIQVKLGRRVEKVDREGQGVRAALSDGQVVKSERILVSVGRKMNTEGLGLDQTAAGLGDRGEIIVNEKMETNEPGIYGIGDAVGRVMLAHVASAEGRLAAANAMAGTGSGLTHRSMDYRVIPSGIFTQPEIGTVGLKEWEAAEQGIKIRVGRYPFRALGRAHTMNEIVGFVKVITEFASGKILGVHMVGPRASDLIHEAALAMQLGARASDVAGMIHAHPTLAEAMMEASDDVNGTAIHHARRPSEG